MIKRFIGAAVTAGTVAAFAALPAFATTSTVVYDNIPTPIPGNIASVGFEATSTSEFGGQIQLAGVNRTSPTVTVLMSSWACENGTWFGGDCSTTSGATFTHPITLNVYNVGSGNSVGSVITSKTQTFTMPYRPSANNVNCSGGLWFDGTSCYNGKAFTISFDLTGVILPNKVIVGVAYNTSNYGASPLGTQPCSSTTQGCPYDSLNVGTNPAPTTGTALPSVNDAYLSSTWGGAYCDNGTSGTGTFRLDAGCWTGYLPAIRVGAQPQVVTPSSKDACKDNGWKTLTDSNGNSFKNQGDCVSFVATGGKNTANSH